MKYLAYKNSWNIKTYQKRLMLQVRHSNNHMIIFPKAVLNSHDIVLPPSGEEYNELKSLCPIFKNVILAMHAFS